MFFRLMKRIVLVMLFSITALLNSCKEEEPKLFTKVDSNHSNVSFTNTLMSSAELNILNYIYYYNGAGLAAADFNNDGLQDLYFVSNENEDELFLNEGALQFKSTTLASGIENKSGWTTGVTVVDINNDDLLDIYLCKVSGYQNLKGHNLLYVNQGIVDGVPEFKELSASYGLNFSGFSTQSAFLDYDLDGDLDMYLMNHSVHPNLNYANGNERTKQNEVSGDKLFENKEGYFVDVSASANIYQGKIGYGLGISISDVNNDSYPDIYVGNDFFENDYLYLNNGDKTFTESISKDYKNLGHTTHFSMGNGIADINNDALTDIVSLDMLPENLETYKSSGTEFSYPNYTNYLKNGYAPQFMQNTLHLNTGHGKFSEIASLANISATEWSWGTLLADFDNDGFKDIFITNGIKGASNDMDFINFIANDNIQKNLANGVGKQEMVFIQKMPEKKVSNYFFKNNGDLTFADVSKTWYTPEKSFSNGTVYSDLDNDGDLDIATNNVNGEAFILENKGNEINPMNYIKIRFKGRKTNNFGIGATVFIYAENTVQKYENYTTKGYLSSVHPSLHIGLGALNRIDSVLIQWPTGFLETLKDVSANQEITVDYENAVNGNVTGKTLSEYSSNNQTVSFHHKDGNSIEFYRDPLIPYATTNEGPSVSVKDINSDGLEDIFVGGAKQQPSALFIQNNEGEFIPQQPELFNEDKVNEDIDQHFFDANGDGLTDLLVVSAGNEFKKGPPLRPRLYINKSGQFTKDTTAFRNIEINASAVKSWDMDNDGDLDILITSDAVPWEFGLNPKQYIFQNDGAGNFSDVTKKKSLALNDLGNVKDVAILDLDNNGFEDLIFVGHWMPITIFMNDGEDLTKKVDSTLANSNGLWNAIEVDDLDNDGDIDLVVGNWGENSKLKTSFQKPLNLYKADIDKNGSMETIVSYYHKNTETVLASKDELAKQIPSLNKKYLSYADFAKAGFNELFPEDILETGFQKSVYELSTCYFENLGNGKFKKHPLPKIAQVSTVQDIFIENNPRKSIILVGNNYEISTQLGRMDASHGLILYPSTNDVFKTQDYNYLGVSGAARSIEKIKIKNKENYVISRNNDSLFFVSKERLK